MRAWIAITLLFSHALMAVTDPSEVGVKVLGLYISKDPYCTSPYEVFTTSEPGFVDFLGGPTIGQLDNSKYQYDGTYRCVIIKMSETVQFVPILGSGVCVSGNRFTTNFCPASTSVTTLDDTQTTCTDAADETVYIYLSTASTAATLTASANPFAPPTASVTTRGLKLNSAVTINGAATLRLIVNAFGKIGTSNGSCNITDLTINFAP